MGARIQQKVGRERRTARIVDDGVEVTYRATLASQKWKVRFEDVLREPIEFTQTPGPMPAHRIALLVLGILFAFVALREPEALNVATGVLIGLCLGGVALGTLFERVPRKQLVQLSSSDPALLLFHDRPSADAMAEFCASLSQATVDYLRMNYPVAEAGTLVEQLERLQALHTAGAVDDEEFARVKAAMLGRSSGTSPGQYL